MKITDLIGGSFSSVSCCGFDGLLYLVGLIPLRVAINVLLPGGVNTDFFCSLCSPDPEHLVEESRCPFESAISRVLETPGHGAWDWRPLHHKA